jgi:cation diffusion facilitator CzcD-associated flavoprotein CzcO
MVDRMTEHTDVVFIGAGLSGIGGAAHLAMRCPEKKYVVLEARDAMGGTWDLFRYPGIRSDSDMYTFGFSFKPWIDDKTLADGPSILAYLKETAEEHDVVSKIRYGQRVTRATWSSDTAKWTLDITKKDGTTTQLTCSFVYSCTGYYDYAGGYDPEFVDRAKFRGTIVHPQKWPEGLDYAGKKVVVIGSGATAVTLVPEMAKKAAHVTMLQRSPTYVASVPSRDKIANALRERLPAQLAYDLTRWKNVGLGMFLYQMSRRRPAGVKKWLVDMAKKELGDATDIAHFTPSYDPWDQRLCAVPDGDLFKSIKDGSASVVTDHIDRFTEKGILLESGQELEADIIVTATGLKILFLGGIEVRVDGQLVKPNEKLLYKGMMLEDVPNLVLAFGYTNASWTLKADLTSEYFCRVLKHMDASGTRKCVARPGADVKDAPFLTFSSGYVQRALAIMPKQGDRRPWRLYMNYALDTLTIRHGKIEDGTLRFTDPTRKAATTAPRVSGDPALVT